MANPPPYSDSNSDTGDDTRVRPDRGSTTRTPRWVMIVGIIILVLVLLYAIMMLAGVGGEHGPGRHTPSGGGPGPGVQTLFYRAAEHLLG